MAVAHGDEVYGQVSGPQRTLGQGGQGCKVGVIRNDVKQVYIAVFVLLTASERPKQDDGLCACGSAYAFGGTLKLKRRLLPFIHEFSVPWRGSHVRFRTPQQEQPLPDIA